MFYKGHCKIRTLDWTGLEWTRLKLLNWSVQTHPREEPVPIGSYLAIFFFNIKDNISSLINN